MGSHMDITTDIPDLFLDSGAPTQYGATPLRNSWILELPTLLSRPGRASTLGSRIPWKSLKITDFVTFRLPMVDAQPAAREEW